MNELMGQNQDYNLSVCGSDLMFVVPYHFILRRNGETFLLLCAENWALPFST